MNVQITTVHTEYNNDSATITPRRQPANKPKKGLCKKSTHWRVICPNQEACPSNRIKSGTCNFLPLATLSRRPFWMVSRNSRRRSSIMKTKRNSRCRRERTEKEFHVTRTTKGKFTPLDVPRCANDDDDGEGASLGAAGSKYYSPRRCIEVHSQTRTMPRLYGDWRPFIRLGVQASCRTKIFARRPPEVWRQGYSGIIFQIFQRSPRRLLCRGIRTHSRVRRSVVEPISLRSSRYLTHLLGRIGAQRYSRCTGPFTNSFIFKCLNRLSLLWKKKTSARSVYR